MSASSVSPKNKTPFPGFLLPWAHAASCAPSDTQVSLFQLDSNGKKPLRPLLSTTTDSSGRYQFSHPQVHEALASGTTRFVVQATGSCIPGALFSRVLTGTTEQDLDSATSLIAAITRLNAEKSSALASVPLEQLHRFTQDLHHSSPNSHSIQDAYALLESESELAHSFQSLFGFPHIHLQESAPWIYASSLPTRLQESTPAQFFISAFHWNPSYSQAIVWKLDGVPVATGANYSYTPIPNSFASHSLSVFIGKNDGSGQIDPASPFTQTTLTLSIENTLPPSPPDLIPQLAQAEPGGIYRVFSPVLSLELQTENALAACNTFSELALIEGNATPIASDFTLTCDTAPTQLIAKTLSSSTAGAKTLKLYARDARGVISPPKTLSLYLDPSPTELAVLSPSDGAALSATALAPLTVSGTCSTREEGRAVSISGATSATATCSSGAWSTELALSSLPEGAFTLSFDLANAGGIPADRVTLSLTKDTTPPTLAFSSLSPASPSNTSTTPQLRGSGSGDLALIRVYDSASCNTTELASGSGAQWSGPGITVGVSENSSTNFYARAWDAAGNASDCVFLAAYTHDSIPPGAPAFLAFTPASPAQSLTPRIRGSAPAAATTLRLYSDSSCSSLLTSGPRSEFIDSGILLPALAANIPNPIYAQTLDLATNASDCTLLATYLHDSIAPSLDGVTLTHLASYPSLTRSPDLTWSGSVAESGSGIARYEYAIGTTAGGSDTLGWSSLGASPSLPWAASGLSLLDGQTYYASLRVIDQAGNTSSVLTSSGWSAQAPSDPAITPSELTLVVGATAEFSVTGGIAPYTFSILSGGGSISPSSATSATLTAPASPASVVVRVTDSSLPTAKTSDATVSVVVDETPPLLGSFILAGGAPSIAQPSVEVTLAASDDFGSVQKMWISELPYEAGVNPPTDLASWRDYESEFTLPLSAVGGMKTLYLWLADSNGNTTPGAMPAQAQIRLDYGAPPSVSILAPLANTITPGGSALTIRWSCEASGGTPLAQYPVPRVAYTDDDGQTFKTIANDQENTLSDSTGELLWSVPAELTGVPYRIMVQCESEAGVVVPALSGMINTASWSIFAGDPTAADEGVNAAVANLSSSTTMTLTGDKAGNIFYVKEHAVMKIDRLSGLVTRFAGSLKQSGCTLSTGSNPLESLLDSPLILGTDSTDEHLFVRSRSCGKIFKIRTLDGYSVEWAEITTTGLLSRFLSRKDILLFNVERKIYKLDLSTPGNPSVHIAGDGICAIASETPLPDLGDSALNTSLVRASVNESNNCNSLLFSNDDATRIWVGPYNIGARMLRLDGNGSNYQVAKVGGFSGFPGTPYPNVDCVTGAYSKIYCRQISASATRRIGVFDPAEESWQIVTLPHSAHTSSVAADNKLGRSAQNLFFYTDGRIVSVKPTSSTNNWEYASIAGENSSTAGNGGALNQVRFSNVSHVNYIPATQTLMIPNDARFLRVIDFTTNPPEVTTRYTTLSGIAKGYNIAYNRLGTFLSYKHSHTDGLRIRSIKIVSSAPGSNGSFGLDHSYTPSSSIPYSYPPADGTPITPSTFRMHVNRLESTQTLSMSNEGQDLYFGTQNIGNDVLLLRARNGVLNHIAGTNGGPAAYDPSDHGGPALTAKLTLIRHIQEIHSGPNSGDLLVWDGNWLRLVTVKTDEASPKIYDLFPFTLASGHPTAGITDFFYDSESEVDGVLGSGKIYFATTERKVYRFQAVYDPNEDRFTSASRHEYTFPGTSFTSGIIRITKIPGKLLVLQPEKDRILAVEP